MADSLTTTDLMASASKVLLEAGYRRVLDSFWEESLGSNARAFEDPYGIVGLVAYETWSDLSSGWVTAQATLVELISKHLTQFEPKAWEGYLVLLTSSVLRGDGRREASEIRHDTNRVRKLVATGEEIRALADLHTVLLPLLPLGDLVMSTAQSALDVLPTMLARSGVPEDAVQILVAAFTNHEPLVESLHTHRTKR